MPTSLSWTPAIWNNFSARQQGCSTDTGPVCWGRSRILWRGVWVCEHRKCNKLGGSGMLPWKILKSGTLETPFPGLSGWIRGKKEVRLNPPSPRSATEYCTCWHIQGFFLRPCSMMYCIGCDSLLKNTRPLLLWLGLIVTAALHAHNPPQHDSVSWFWYFHVHVFKNSTGKFVVSETALSEGTSDQMDNPNPNPDQHSPSPSRRRGLKLGLGWRW